jgi:hypothetical protein
VDKRHRRIRARSATGQVAGAATEKPGLNSPIVQIGLPSLRSPEGPSSQSTEPKPAPGHDTRLHRAVSCPEKHQRCTSAVSLRTPFTALSAPLPRMRASVELPARRSLGTSNEPWETSCSPRSLRHRSRRRVADPHTRLAASGRAHTFWSRPEAAPLAVDRLEHQRPSPSSSSSGRWTGAVFRPSSSIGGYLPKRLLGPMWPYESREVRWVRSFMP